MRKKGFLALAGTTFVLLVLAIAAAATGEHAATRAPPGERAFPALAARLGDVVSIGLVRPPAGQARGLKAHPRDPNGSTGVARGPHNNGVRLDFVRVGERWLVVEKGNYPAAAHKLRRIALALADLSLVERKTREPKLYPRLEVEDPGTGKSTLVTLKDGSGTTLAALIVGKQRADRLGEGVGGVYVRRPGHRQSWLAAGSLDLSGDAASWLERTILDIPENRIAEVTLTRPDGHKLVIGRAAPNGKFALAGAPAGAKSGPAPGGTAGGAASQNRNDDTTLGEPAVMLASLDLDDVAPAARDPIPRKGVVAAHYRTFDGLAVDLRMVERGKTAWIAVNAAGSGKTAAEAQAIERRVGPWIYAIPSYKADLLRAPLAPPAKS